MMPAARAIQIAMPAKTKQAITDWLRQGFSVTVKPDGEIIISPVTHLSGADPFDYIDMKAK